MSEIVTHEDLSPDSPKSGLVKKIRDVVRALRIMKLRYALKKKFKIGDNVSIGPSAQLMIPDFFKIGDNFSSGKNFFVQTNVSIGNDCLISSDVSFVGNDHTLNNPKMTAYWSGRLPPSVISLEGNNFIGYRATIVGNVRIGEGAVVAAGALVLNDVEKNSIVGGVPARHIKYRFE